MLAETVNASEAVIKAVNKCKCGYDKDVLGIEYHKKAGFPMQVKRCAKCGEKK